jgi:hypothetical protein
MTVLSLMLFRDMGADTAILETGIGGALDATNYVPRKLAAIITPVSFDHTELLGTTIADIAAQKAGIIRPRTPVICAPQPYADTVRVVQETAAELDAPFHAVDPNLDIDPFTRGRILPPFQENNLRTALTACRVLGIRPDPARLRLPRPRGRCEIIRRRPPIVLDAAHNAHSAAELTAALQVLFPGTRFTVILGIAPDKDARGIYSALLPVAGFRRRTPEGRLAARVGAGTLGLGLLVTLLNSSTKYQAVTSTMGYGDLALQPEVQRERLLGDLPGFVWASVETWFTELNHYVQDWFRNFGFFTSRLPAALPWLFLLLLVAALLRLDRKDFRGLRGPDRWLLGLGAAGMILVLFSSSYVYFTDHVAYDTIGQQMARYSAPLLMVMLLAGAPRRLVRTLDRLPEEMARLVLAAIPVLATASILLTWLVTGTADRY